MAKHIQNVNKMKKECMKNENKRYRCFASKEEQVDKQIEMKSNSTKKENERMREWDNKRTII